MFETIRNLNDIDRCREKIEQSAASVCEFLAAANDQPLHLLSRMKFECIGRHPIDNRPLNLVEQINQTWTFVTALAATQKLLALHPAEGFRLAPGAHAPLPLDIMSEREGMVGAETFAAVDPRNNGKLAKDLAKLERYPAIRHRYVFFMSPDYPRDERQTQFERPGIEVWSVHFNI
jgi:hypothetical protein